MVGHGSLTYTFEQRLSEGYNMAGRKNRNKKNQGGAASSKSTGGSASALKTSVSQLDDDQKCIYQAVSALEDNTENALGNLVMQSGKVKEVDDEAALLVLAEHYEYTGPHVCTGKEFKTRDLSAYSKVLVMVSGDHKLKNDKFLKADPQTLAELLMDPSNTSGVTAHAIGITISKGKNTKNSRVYHDEQKLRKDGPFENDTVIYWVK